MTAEAQQLMFQAIGCVTGTLIKGEDDRHTLLTEHCEVPVRGIRARLLYRLQKNPDQISGQWTVYPHSTLEAELQSVHLGTLNVGIPDLPCTFCIAGRVVFQREGLIAIRIHPNDQARFKPFNITIAGYLPEQAFGQFWKLEVELEAGRLVMQDAIKLADAEPRPENSKQAPKRTNDNADQPEPATECA